jgi:hypothetical protein
MSEPPPAYKEIPGEDLVAELAKMKAMMEQMRLDKERLETEAKRKAEEDAAMEVTRKKEQEEMLARLRMEQEEARELEETYKRLKEIVMQRNAPTIDSMSLRDEIVLFSSRHSNTYGIYLITNKNVYRSLGHTPPHKLGLIYTFNTTLTKKQVLLLEQGITSEKTGEGQGNIIDRVRLHVFGGSEFGGSADYDMRRRNAYMCVSALKKFESIIRLIPGSYQNGDWRQLDGFFGMYFNETTMEFSEVPPPL